MWANEISPEDMKHKVVAGFSVAFLYKEGLWPQLFAATYVCLRHTAGNALAPTSSAADVTLILHSNQEQTHDSLDIFHLNTKTTVLYRWCGTNVMSPRLTRTTTEQYSGTTYVRLTGFDSVWLFFKWNHVETGYALTLWKVVSGKQIQVVLLADEDKRYCSSSGKGLGLIVLQRQSRFLLVWLTFCPLAALRLRGGGLWDLTMNALEFSSGYW